MNRPILRRNNIEAVDDSFVPSTYQAGIFETAKDKGNVAVEAVAGSGKTTTMVQLVSRLRKAGYGSVQFCAFNKHIAEEVSLKLPPHMPAKTIHSLGMFGLRKVTKNIKVDSWKYSNLCKEHAIQSVALHPKKLEESQKKAERQLTATLNALVALVQSSLVEQNEERLRALTIHYGVEINDYDFSLLVETVSTILKEGEELAAKQGIISFSDMLYLPRQWNLSLPVSDVVLVDEAQDLSPAQMDVVSRVAGSSGRVYAVGDSHQAIMGFAGADSESFATLKASFQMTELPLSVCYRCPTSHLDIARNIVPHIENAPTAVLGVVEETEGSEALILKVRPRDLVLCRKTAPLVRLCLMMWARNIPSKVKGAEIGNALSELIDKISSQSGFCFAQFGRYQQQWEASYCQRVMESEPEEVAERKLKVVTERLDCLSAIMEAHDFTYEGELHQFIRSMFVDEEGMGVTLSTIHRAKGLEAERVHVIENWLPLVWSNQSSWEFTQERNLQYVAFTRSKSYLNLVWLEDDF